MPLPGAAVVRRNVAVGAVCATVLVVSAELLVPAVLGGPQGETTQYALYLVTFSLWMTWFVLTGVDVLAAGE